MIYIEYFSRRPGVDLQEFHAGVKKGLAWDANFSEDRLVLCAARTWRLGPRPEYFMVWHSPDAGFARLDAWEKIFRSGGADQFEKPFLRVARVESAGCYEALLEPLRAREGLYYAEFFRPTGNLDAVRALYQRRAKRRGRVALNLLAHRVGRLAPAPGGLAVWTLPDFAALEDIARELEGSREVLEFIRAGTYVDIGGEIL